MAKTIHGNTSGLKASQTRALEKLYGRKINQDLLVTQEFATQLTFISEEINRLVGVLVNRRGKVEYVMVGNTDRLYLPDIGRQRAARGRFRGLRLLRTHLSGQSEPLGRDDKTDLSKLRLDAVASILVGPGGYPGALHWAHLIPKNPENRIWTTYTLDSPSHLEEDFLSLISELEAEFQRKADQLIKTAEDNALLIHVDLPGGRASEDITAELLELCRTAQISIQDVIVQKRPKPDPKYVVGRGKLEQIVLQALQQDVELLIFSCDLAPRQMRAITDMTDLRVVDRTQVILDIFARHAMSADGKLQVELAQLKYTLPRLIARNTGMSRLTGGIGGRGPGETKLEINRRRSNDRIQFLNKKLQKLSKQRNERRSRRRSSGLPVVSIVGYTNAGKSTLLNALTNSTVISEDKLFATLTPASRRLRFPEEHEVILTDTVGFIHDLPKDLVAAFKATLEELEEADILLHLVDASSEEFESRIKAVRKILSDLELSHKQELLVFNKIDQLPPGEGEALARLHDAIPVSALERATIEPLVDELHRSLFVGRARSLRESSST